jgi:cytochrome c oxidase assembly protein subunit 15
LSLRSNANVTEPRHNPGLHRLALLTAAATFPLIFMGGLVTSHGAGMSVPDWPNSYGYNMFLFPPNLWVGGILYEHTHRLMGTVVGFCSILLVLRAWGTGRNAAARKLLGRCAASFLALGLLAAAGPFTYHNNQALTGVLRHAAVGLVSVALVTWCASLFRARDERPWVRWLTVGVLAAVIVQGTLGGLRVRLVKLDLAVIHACFAQAFFCLAALTAVVTSRWWQEAPRLPAVGARGAVALAGVAVAAIYLQLVAGALMRHYGAGLAIPDLPLAYGKLLPPVSQGAMDLANEARRWDYKLPGVSLGQVWLHFAHRVGAAVVSAAVISAAVHVLRRRRGQGLTVPAVLMLALLVAQVALGVFTVLYRKPADVASAHVAAGALLLVTTFVMTIRAARLNWVAPKVAMRPSSHAGASAAPPRISTDATEPIDPSRPAEDIQGGAELAPA